ncbi:MAG: hypothetical protein BGO12_02720 [Verrucomicrobia bacterium 61-8]|nr:MAG: hypothetical protein BGO12_02720 [Verrucomicrobia bacterium 61-8]
MQELARLSSRLAAHDVRFVIVGGLSVIMHGSALMTRDVDVVCSVDSENLLRIHTALEELHPVHRMTPAKLPFTREQALSGGLKNLYLTTDWGQLDCLGEIKGVGDYEACRRESEILEIDGCSMRVLSIDALIQAKRAMGRPRDLHAVLELEAIRERQRKSDG